MAAAVEQIHKALRPGGVALITVPGISPIHGGPWKESWYWSLTDLALDRLLSGSFDAQKVTLTCRGNLFAATAFLHGAAVEEVAGPSFRPVRSGLSGDSRGAGGRVTGGEFVSVVMPVYNALPHLDGAVRSILDQSLHDFEFVIYDDGSTDGSTERLREWAREELRIRLFEGERNLGPVGSSAIVVEHSTAPLVARMDADDLCSPNRLALELEVLRSNPRAGLVGTLFDVIDDRGRKIRGPDLWRLTRKAPFVPFVAAHGSILFRRSVFDQVGGYRAECEYWEDQDLVVRMAAVTEVWVIPSALYQVRQWTKSTRATSSRERVENAVDLMYRAVARLEQGRSYDDLLRIRSQPTRVDPRVFISAGSIVLLVRGPPKVVRAAAKARPPAVGHADCECFGVDHLGSDQSSVSPRVHGPAASAEESTLERHSHGSCPVALVASHHQT